MARKVVFTHIETEKVDDFVHNIPAVRSEVVKATSSGSRKLVSRTAEALERLRTEAAEEGFQLGFEEGRGRGYQDALATSEIEFGKAVAEFRDELEAKAATVLASIEDWYGRAEQHLAELAVAIAARILSQEIQLGHDTITALTKEALAEVRNASSARIKVNPFDSAALEKRKAELLASCSSLRGIEITEDPSILGGCVIETDCGTIDAQIQTQLEIIDATLKEAA